MFHFYFVLTSFSISSTFYFSQPLFMYYIIEKYKNNNKIKEKMKNSFDLP